MDRPLSFAAISGIIGGGLFMWNCKSSKIIVLMSNIGFDFEKKKKKKKTPNTPQVYNFSFHFS